ncbi:MAG: hypothetical protein ABR925_01715 [Acidimicrobiales bacterium]
MQLGSPAAQGTPSASHLNTGQKAVMCAVTSRNVPDTSANVTPVAAEPGAQLQVTVPPVVFVTVKSGVLQVTTNTGLPPAATDEFYLIRGDQADRAPARVIETVLRSCR